MRLLYLRQGPERQKESVSEYLDLVDEQLERGTASPQSLVLLFRAGEEAEERRDIAELERTLALARRLARTAGETLAAEAERLIALCEQRLERTRAAREPATTTLIEGASTCPGCGRPITPSALRCRACGTLLVYGSPSVAASWSTARAAD